MLASVSEESSLGKSASGANEVSVSASSSAGLTLTYSIASGPATISGSTVHITGIGNIVVRATQAGNYTYLSAVSDYSINITSRIRNPYLGDIQTFSAQKVVVFPNPSNGVIHITHENKLNAVLVYDAKGYDNSSKVFRGISEGRVTVKQDSELPDGTYFYVLKYTKSNGTVKEKAGYLYINRK